MGKPVIAIGLDAAEPSVIERWMAEGHLKTLQRLREQGVYGRLKNFAAFSAETPWTTFLTGCAPTTTGYWSPLRLQQGNYAVESIAAYDFEEYPPFYALGESYRVAIFDVPQILPSSRVNGLQVSAWGAHSPQVPSTSLPAELFQELVGAYGNHPGLHRDYACCLDLPGTLKLQEILKTGIARRSAICQDLLQREAWDLFLTVFGEAHAAGHNFWHLSQPDHPLYQDFQPFIDHDPLLETFQAIDTAIGQILAKAPENSQVIVFSAHGMGANTMDLPSTTFLPEFLYRLAFPGQQALLHQHPQGAIPAPATKMQWNYWERHIWNTKTDKSWLRKFLRHSTPTRLYRLLQPFIEGSRKTDLIPPLRLVQQTDVVPFQPATWYMPLWPQMPAFALPSFAEGYIRVNLQGREPQGIVPPDAYDAFCADLTQKLHNLRDARSGVAMVKQVIQTRQSGDDSNLKRPDADLVVVWQDEYATDTVESPDVGRIGPAAHLRAGSHRPEGFILAVGRDIPHGGILADGHALDLAPTILSMMGAPIAARLEGGILPLQKPAVVASGV